MQYLCVSDTSSQEFNFYETHTCLEVTACCEVCWGYAMSSRGPLHMLRGPWSLWEICCGSCLAQSGPLNTVPESMVLVGRKTEVKRKIIHGWTNPMPKPVQRLKAEGLAWENMSVSVDQTLDLILHSSSKHFKFVGFFETLAVLVKFSKPAILNQGSKEMSGLPEAITCMLIVILIWAQKSVWKISLWEGVCLCWQMLILSVFQHRLWETKPLHQCKGGKLWRK